MRIDVLTLFPEMLEPFFSASIIGRARRAGIVDIVCTQIRDFATDRHQSTEALARESRLLVLCGHYEGFDQRIIDGLAPREISIGDYVLSGGEPAAAVLIDAVVRLLPGALGDENSAASESFRGNRLEYPQYTRPREFRGMSVPEVLLSGDHGRIAEWRRGQQDAITRSRRPDLLEK